jgi:hypothetical protein
LADELLQGGIAGSGSYLNYAVWESSNGYSVSLFTVFVFAIVDRLGGPTIGLVAGAVVSAILLLRDLITPGRTPKILEIGTFILFGAMALYVPLGGTTWSVIGVRLCVDAGLLAIVLVSMAVGRPLTLQYAREQVAREVWSSPEFIRVNYVITAVRALAFALMVIAELALLYVPNMPSRVGIITIIIALVGAVKFTGWYPDRKKGGPAGNAG